MAQRLRERLIGTWKLESYVEKPVDGSAPFFPMGERKENNVLRLVAAGRGQRLADASARAHSSRREQEARTSCARLPRSTAWFPECDSRPG